MQEKLHASACIIVLVMLGAGCKVRRDSNDHGTSSPSNKMGDEMPVPKETAANGWPLYRLPDDGFAIALPPDWRHVIVNPQSIDQTVDLLTRNNPDLAAMAESMKEQIRQGIKFFGFAPKDDPVLRGTNVTVARLPTMGEKPGDIVDDTMATLAQVYKPKAPAKIDKRKTKHATMDRAFLSGSLSIGRGKSIDIAVLVCFIFQGDEVYLVTITTGAADFSKLSPTADTIVESFQILKK